MASLKDIVSIKITGAVDITIPDRLDVPESMIFYLKTQPDGRANHQGMEWRLITKQSRYFSRYIERFRTGTITSNNDDVIDGWIFFSFSRLMRYYFYHLIGSVNFDDSIDLLNPHRPDADYIQKIFIPLIGWLESLCEIIVVFKESKSVDPVDNLANAIQSIASAPEIQSTVRKYTPGDSLSKGSDREILLPVYKVDVTNNLDHNDGVTIDSGVKISRAYRVCAFRLAADKNINLNDKVCYLYDPEEFSFESNENFDFSYLPVNKFNFSFIPEMGSVVCNRNDYKYLVFYY